ncbi:hypothetical protein SPRG_06253 [Saprolegnia parasitica CBS 223.65]|uniref:Uncharacterized protein n=1 Tax=Saprolegnia parasitica (strain CBS 223.65) TaxID=695850 RepID=A0A067CBU8_SAPPC|nr:hypothetical protein SPRG_06253 [Saprolegnia parasitica CBS 223.65]KDO28204.1 hypothetical protein SPRG_06253 [Saprolegnia parasitica CBS 223.65]|eukprot:XP_012201029.1 hypothetical protein SPRG_06253 [Saprolegnia parasitica CBS 223.65]
MSAAEASTSRKRKRSTETKDLDNLALSLKLKSLVAEACLSDMNNVVIEKNLIAIAKELAVMRRAGLFSDARCLRFLCICFERIQMLLAKVEHHAPLTVTAESLWESAKWQVSDAVHADVLDTAAVTTCYENAVRDVKLLWKAMVLSREQGANLWHEHKQEEAVHVLKTSEVYMRRFHLKYQKLNIDYALLHSTSSPAKKATTKKSVSFAASPTILGTADADVDRSPTSCSKPSKLDALLLRSSRNFPTPSF